MSIDIHPTAVVDPKANLSEGVVIGPYAVVEAGVTLASGVQVGPYVHLRGNTYIGDNTFIASGAVIGQRPQSVNASEGGAIRIGKNNVIREYVTIHSSLSSEAATTLGDNNFLMVFSHIGHDCKIADNVVTCPSALIGGHVELAERAFISGGVVVHQFVRVGRCAMVSGLSRVNQDVPPFMLVVGDSRVWGINLVGARRAGMSTSQIRQIKNAFKTIYRSKLSLKTALGCLENEGSDLAREIKVFILASKRGICGPKRAGFFERIFLDYPYFVRVRLEAVSCFSRARGLYRRMPMKAKRLV